MRIRVSCRAMAALLDRRCPADAASVPVARRAVLDARDGRAASPLWAITASPARPIHRGMASTEHRPYPTEGPTSLDERRPRRPPRRHRWLLLITLVFLAALAAAAGGWIYLHQSGTTSTKRAPANLASLRALADLPTAVGHPVYWAGPKPGYRYELTHTTDGRIYIRYLPAGVAPGTTSPDYLTVGTYPVKNAFTTVQAIGHKPGGSLLQLAGGGIAASDPGHPLSTYVAYTGLGYEIEVYSPTPGQAHELVSSGAIVPTGATSVSVTPIAPTAASIGTLRALASSAGHSVYWAGPRVGTTYELSELSDGRIFVRYLPKGVQVGARRPFTTVGTYPVPNAFSAVLAIAKRPGATQIKLSNGGIAVTDPAHPTSVYLAYPNGTLEVEVFDPTTGRARQLVENGAIVPVS